MNDADRLDFALRFADRVVDIGATARSALTLAAERYQVDPEVLLVEWCRRLIAEHVAAEAVEKASRG